jgi:hypothetical protein
MVAMAPQIRSLFAMLLEFETVANAGALWEKHKDKLCDDFLRNAIRTHHGAEIDVSAVENRGLLAMHKLLEHLNKPLTKYGLPAPDFSAEAAEAEHHLLAQHRNYDQVQMRAVVTSKLATANTGQETAFTRIRAAVDEVLEEAVARAAGGASNARRQQRSAQQRRDKPRCFFLNGPAGTGKTFVYDMLLAYVRGQGHIALATATCGIAALLLPGGATAHNTFKIPVEELNAESQCSLKLTQPLSPAVQAIAEAALLLIDEAPMMNKHAYGAIDKSLRDITGVDEPFGGKVVVLGGDFRQCLPVVRRAQPAQIVQICLKRSYLWSEFTVLSLTENERVRRATVGASAEVAAAAQAYAAYLLRIGDGTEATHPLPDGAQEDYVRVPSGMLIPESTSSAELVRIIYGDDERAFTSTDKDELHGRTILAPRNKDVDEINDVALDLFPLSTDTPSSPAYREYYSADTVADEEDGSAYQPEVLNAVTLGGLPHHKLRLKKGAIVMLLRNLSPRDGLANGTRLIVLDMFKNLLQVQIVGGVRNGEVCLIPRITTKSSEADTGFILHRRQFPVKLAFAMTINKSQGQTLRHVALYLPHPVFAHGQLYTALSRVGDPRHIKILVRGGCRSDGRTYVANVVYHQVTQ